MIDMSMIKTSTEPQWGGFLTSFIKKDKTSAATAPVLGLAKRFAHGSFQFQVRLTRGAAYTIEASSNLLHWTSLDSGTAPGSTVDYMDSAAAKFDYRFYRATCGELASQKWIGFASVNLPPGFSMIANPFHAPSNYVPALFPDMPEGTTLCKFDTTLFRLTNNSVKKGEWTNASEKLVPGEGAIFFNPTTNIITLNFVGEVIGGHLLNPIPTGLSIRSSLVPQPGRLNSDLGFPVAEGDVVHIFDRAQQKYTLYPYSAKGWERNPPVVGVGESFWIARTQPGEWVRDLAVA